VSQVITVFNFNFILNLCLFMFTHALLGFIICLFSLGSIDEALWFLEKCVIDAAERDEAMSEILVPIIEHVIS